MQTYTILGVDPGNLASGWFWLRVERETYVVLGHGHEDNETFRQRFVADFLRVESESPCLLAVETPKPQGMAVSGETMETLVAIGRFVETWHLAGGDWTFVFRPDVKHFLCGSTIAKDGNVSQALKDMFGGEQKGVKCVGCGGKGAVGRGKDRGSCSGCSGSGWSSPPGPLAKVAGHAWAALGVAVWQSSRPLEADRQRRILNPDSRKKPRRAAVTRQEAPH